MRVEQRYIVSLLDSDYELTYESFATEEEASAFEMAIRQYSDCTVLDEDVWFIVWMSAAGRIIRGDQLDVDSAYALDGFNCGPYHCPEAAQEALNSLAVQQ